MDEQPPASPEPAEGRDQPWARTALWLGIVLIVTAAGVYLFKSCAELPGRAVDKTVQVITNVSSRLADLATAFNQGSITTSFISYASSISAGHYLQFARLKQTEIFTRTDEATTAFGYIPLPDVVVEARAPVEYTYYLDLNAKWELVLKDGVLYVFAPPIQFNKPAVDASEIQYEVRKGSVLRDTVSAQENLKKTVTFLTQRRAKENIALVRETGRRQTMEFVEKWLVQNFSDGRKYPVKILFADEATPEGLKVLPPAER
jgi:hypothetical protein